MNTVKDAGKPSYEEMYTRIADIVRDYFKEFFGSSEDVPPSRIARDVPLNSWAGCMCHVFASYVSHIQIRDTTLKPWHNGGRAGGPAYDLDMIEDLANIYMTLCKAYDKPQSALAFADMVGIDNNTISHWGRIEAVDSVTSRRNRIYKIIVGARKEAITNRVLDGGARTLGAVTMYNNEVLPGAGRNDSGGLISGDGLPRLALPGTND